MRRENNVKVYLKKPAITQCGKPETRRVYMCHCISLYEYYLIFLSFEDNNEDEPIGFNMLLESEAYSPVSFVLLSFVNLRS